MDAFRHCAEEILDIARMGGTDSLTVLLHDNGPGVRPGLHLIMGEAQAGCLPARGARTAAFRVTTLTGAGRSVVRVQGAQGARSCDLRAAATPLPSPLPFLLNNQALYELTGGRALAV